MSLESAYDAIQNELHVQLDESFDTVRAVQRYRDMWKPDNRVRVVLLAESHVFTSDNERINNAASRDRLAEINAPDCSTDFVRFVYNLAYGESDLMQNQAPLEFNNSGTPQFWKIFYACLNQVSDSKEAFSPILRTRCPDFHSRLGNKLGVLRSLKERGIWLVDASIIGIYRGRDIPYGAVINHSWQEFVGPLLKSISPELVFVIGHGVWKSLSALMDSKLRSRCHVLYQPQARISTQEHTRQYQCLYNGCKYFAPK